MSKINPENNQTKIKINLADYHYKNIEIIKKLSIPKAYFTSNNKVAAGDEIEIQLADFKPVSIDLTKESPAFTPINKNVMTNFIILFQGKNNKIPVKAKLDNKKDRIKVKVPADAVDGVVSLFIPIKKIFKSEQDRETERKTDELLTLLQRQISDDKLIKNNKSQTCSCKSNVSNNGKIIIGNRCIDKGPGIILQQYKPIMIGWLTVRCSECAINCPNYALRFDENGDCYIDPNFCRGHRYQTDRNVLNENNDYTRFNENSCWACFESNELYSRRCKQGKLRKVLHIEKCGCANCPPASCHIDGMNLMELCENEAISMLPFPDMPWWYYFTVDKEKCIGCMVCYNNITCFNNIEYGGYIRMVSMIDNKANTLSISLVRIYFVSIDDSDFSPVIKSTLILTSYEANKQYPFQLNPDNNYSYTFPDNHFVFRNKVDISVMNDESYFGYCQSNFKLPAVYVSDVGGKQSDPQKVVLRTASGDFVLEYFIAKI